MLHFRKDNTVFQRFALEMVDGNPSLLGLRKVGHDMDPALKKGCQAVFKEAENLLCIQHVSERDKQKLEKLKGTPRKVGEILTDIYGSQRKEYHEAGLADSTDEEEFNVRLESLKDVWEEKVPGFHSWFTKKRAPLFIQQVIGEAMDRLQICERFTTNRLEIFHKIQKMFCEEGNCKGDPVAVMLSLQKWMMSFEIEAEKAFTGQGKFRLAPGYDGFKWTRYMYWSGDEKEEHQKFLNFVPPEADT